MEVKSGAYMIICEHFYIRPDEEIGKKSNFRGTLLLLHAEVNFGDGMGRLLSLEVLGLLETEKGGDYH